MDGRESTARGLGSCADLAGRQLACGRALHLLQQPSWPQSTQKAKNSPPNICYSKLRGLQVVLQEVFDVICGDHLQRADCGNRITGINGMMLAACETCGKPTASGGLLRPAALQLRAKRGAKPA